MRAALVLMTILLLAVPGAVYGIGISVYIAGPGVMVSPVTGGATETFDGIDAANYRKDLTTAVGTVQLSRTNRLQVQAQDQYGGAGNTGRYAVFGAQNGYAVPVALDLTAPTTYFGMWMSALDPLNGISVYSGGSLIRRYSASSLADFLGSNSQLTALDGTTQYTTADYLGKPGTGPPKLNNGEYYAYVMFQGIDTTFDRLVFDNSGSTASGFEMDNWHVRTGTFEIPRESVLVYTTPEPDVWVPAALGLGVAVYWRRRKKVVGEDGGVAAGSR